MWSILEMCINLHISKYVLFYIAIYSVHILKLMHQFFLTSFSMIGTGMGLPAYNLPYRSGKTNLPTKAGMAGATSPNEEKEKTFPVSYYLIWLIYVLFI